MKIGFPLTIPEITKMYKDGDKISVVFSLLCITSVVLVPVFGAVYYFSSLKIYKDGMFICIVLAAIFWFIVCIHRSRFESDPRRKYKDLNKLGGSKLEKELKKMSDEERDDYLNDLKNEKR